MLRLGVGVAYPGIVLSLLGINRERMKRVVGIVLGVLFMGMLLGARAGAQEKLLPAGWSPGVWGILSGSAAGTGRPQVLLSDEGESGCAVLSPEAMSLKVEALLRSVEEMRVGGTGSEAGVGSVLLPESERRELGESTDWAGTYPDHRKLWTFSAVKNDHVFYIDWLVAIIGGYVKLGVDWAVGFDKYGRSNPNGRKIFVDQHIYAPLVGYTTIIWGATNSGEVRCYHDPGDDPNNMTTWEHKIKSVVLVGNEIFYFDRTEENGRWVIHVIMNGYNPVFGTGRSFDVDFLHEKYPKYYVGQTFSLSEILRDSVVTIRIPYGEYGDSTLYWLWRDSGRGGEDVLLRDYGLVWNDHFTLRYPAGMSGSTPLKEIAPGEAAFYVDGLTARNHYQSGMVHLRLSGYPISEHWVRLEHPDTVYIYNEAPHTPKVIVKTEHNVLLLEGRDYTVSYNNNINAGEGQVIVTGIKDYSGTVVYPFRIDPTEFMDGWVGQPSSPNTYTGEPVRPEITVVNGSKLLLEGRDYGLTYSDDINAGTVTMTISGRNNYVGSTTRQYVITPKPLRAGWLSDTLDTQSYTGSALTPAVSVTDGDRRKALIAGTDYNVVYTDNTGPGQAIATVIGRNNYSGTLRATFHIVQEILHDWLPDIPVQSWSGEAIRPDISISGLYGSQAHTLQEGTDYSLTYAYNINVGTAYAIVAGKGDYSGTVWKAFGIVKGINFFIDEIPPQTRNGQPLEPAIDVRDRERVLSYGADYTTTFSDNTDAGRAFVMAHGKNWYEGEAAGAYFTILPTPLQDEWLHLVRSDTMYQAHPIVLPSNALQVIDRDGRQLEPHKDFSWTLTNSSDAGEWRLTATGNGNYAGAAAQPFRIHPRPIESQWFASMPDSVSWTGQAVEPRPIAVIWTRTDGYPAVSLTLGTDYTIQYINNASPGVAAANFIGIGNYEGEVRKEFVITDNGATPDRPVTYDLSMCNAKVTAIDTLDNTYAPHFTVTDSRRNNRTLVRGVDYDYDLIHTPLDKPVLITLYSRGDYKYSIVYHFDPLLYVAPPATPNPNATDQSEPTDEYNTDNSAPINIAATLISVYGVSEDSYDIQVKGLDGTLFTEDKDWTLTAVLPGDPPLLLLTGKGRLVGERYVLAVTSGSEDALAVAPRALSQGPSLLLCGLAPGQPFAIYSLTGALVVRNVALPDGAFTISHLAPGAYILYHQGRYSKFVH